MSNQFAVPIDHLVINVLKEMDAAHDTFKQLGFTMTPRGRHTMGSINHLMIFEKDYIELIGLPVDGTILRDELLGNPIGIDGIVFQSSDAEQTYQTLTKRKQSLLPVQSFSRPVDLDGKKSMQVLKLSVLHRASFLQAESISVSISHLNSSGAKNGKRMLMVRRQSLVFW